LRETSQHASDHQAARGCKISSAFAAISRTISLAGFTMDQAGTLQPQSERASVTTPLEQVLTACDAAPSASIPGI
jgi:hypothetical protein